MPSNHIQRINDDIQRTLASLLREVKDPRVQQGDLLSIVRTETTGDLRYCTVYLSVLGDVNEKELKKDGCGTSWVPRFRCDIRRS